MDGIWKGMREMYGAYVILLSSLKTLVGESFNEERKERTRLCKRIIIIIWYRSIFWLFV